MRLRRFKTACDFTGATWTWSDVTIKVSALIDFLVKARLLDRDVAVLCVFHLGTVYLGNIPNEQMPFSLRLDL